MLQGLSPDAQRKYTEELKDKPKLTPLLRRLISKSLSVISNDKEKQIIKVKAKDSEEIIELSYDTFTEYLRHFPEPTTK